MTEIIRAPPRKGNRRDDLGKFPKKVRSKFYF